MGKLDGKVAIISGAARGQGRSHAVTLARAGARLALFDICRQLETTNIPMSRPADLEETVALVKDVGGDVIALEADVRSSKETQTVVDATLDAFGRVDIVIANAGIDSIESTLAMRDEVWDDMIAVNLTGVFRTIQPALRPMIEQREGGSVVITSSCAGLTPFPNHVHYGATKYGVIGVTQCLALELAAHRIRVNAVAPTAVNTPLAVNSILFELFTGRAEATEEEAAEVFRRLHLIDEPWVQPQDISNAVLWLSSDDARYVTGIVLPVDLGLLIKGPFDAKDSAARLDASSAKGLVD